MHSRLAISGLVIGSLLITVGTVLLVLSFATKILDETKKIENSKASASIVDGSSLIGQAKVSWDDTTITLDSAGKLIKWSSIKSYTETTGALYTYDLVPYYTTGQITSQLSSSGLRGVYFDGTNFLQNKSLTTTRNWSSFPKNGETDPYTVVLACSNPCGANSNVNLMNGIGYRHIGDAWTAYTGHQYELAAASSTQSYLKAGSLGQVYRSTTPVDVPNYIPVNKTETRTDNICGFTYTAVQATAYYLNGQRIQIGNASVITTSGLQLSIGQGTDNTTGSSRNNVGTLYAVYVFDRVLTQDEMMSVSMFLQKKYFAPTLKYPSVINGEVGLSMTTPIRNLITDGTAPITNYSISPDLPKGLVLNMTTGEISGTPSVETPVTLYTISATNKISTNNTTMNIQISQPATQPTAATEPTIANKVFVLPPIISLLESTIVANSGSPIQSSAPLNTGGATTSFSIDPVSSIVDLGLSFDSNTGVVSGSAKHACNISFTITANNDGGSGSAVLRLQVGTTIVYPIQTIVGSVDKIIVPVMPNLSSASVGTVGSYSYSGDLLGLSFESRTGAISGIPKRSGKSNIVVYLSLVDETERVSTAIQILIDGIQTEKKQKSFYKMAGYSAVGVGAAILGASAVLEFIVFKHQKSSERSSEKSSEKSSKASEKSSKASEKASSEKSSEKSSKASEKSSEKSSKASEKTSEKASEKTSAAESSPESSPESSLDS